MSAQADGDGPKDDDASQGECLNMMDFSQPMANTVSGAMEGAQGVRRVAWVSRMRVQLLGGLLASMGGPLLLRLDLLGFEDADPITRHVPNTLGGVFFAVLFGYYALRRLSVFPGIKAVGFALPVFTVSFLLVIAAFFFLRLEYGRFQFLGGYLIAVLWFTAIMALSHRAGAQRLALIPVGFTAPMRSIEGVAWSVVENPQSPPLGCAGVVADLRADHPPEWQRYITDCVLSGVPVYHVKQVRESLTGRVEIDHLSENTLGSLNPNDAYLRLKYMIDSLAAVALLVFALPMLCLIGLMIRLDSQGPALFKQDRVGLRGSVFTMYKFRTMVDRRHDMDAREAAITQDRDPRITRIGWFLRQTRLDELPQLINILKGEMSWIGPRPEAVPLSKWYEGQLPFYRYRHIVRPGITGWAQVSQGHVADPDKVLEKLHYDFFYVKNFSLWLDVLIVMKTVRTMLTGFGAR